MRYRSRSARPQAQGVEIPATASATLAEVLAIYNGSNGDATRAMYDRLNAMGPLGVAGADVFRAQKCSARAKLYRRGNEKGSYRQQAYDRKEWSMHKLATGLLGADLGLTWGWAVDPAQEAHAAILYVDLPTGQISWHTGQRGVGPDYSKPWDGIRGVAPTRTCRWVAQLLERT